MLLSVPAVQALLVAPQTPLTFGSEQEAVVPPFNPMQFQKEYSELSTTSMNEPIVHALRVAPHTPLIGVGALTAAHEAVVPPSAPTQLHEVEPFGAGLAGAAGLAVPALQYAPAGKVAL
jgi:hypothetical protein